MLRPKVRRPGNCRRSQSHAVAQLNLSAKLCCQGHRPRFYGMLYVESENPPTGLDAAIFAGDHNARPGQSFEWRRGPGHRKYPECQVFWPIMKCVGKLVDVRRASSGIGVAKFPSASLGVFSKSLQLKALFCRDGQDEQDFSECGRLDFGPRQESRINIGKAPMPHAYPVSHDLSLLALRGNLVRATDATAIARSPRRCASRDDKPSARE